MSCGRTRRSGGSGTPHYHFGKELTVQWFAGTEETKPVALKVRVRLVGGRLQEYRLGPLREITDRFFVVRRAFRVNESPPQIPLPRPLAVATRGLASAGPR